MANYSAIKATVNAYIKQNGKKEITGHILNSVLNATIDSLGRYFQFAGGAMPTDDPGTPDQNVCYLAGEPGVYTNFGGITVENEEVALLFWDGEWTKQRVLLGIQEVEASVDNQVGTPSVDVSYSGGQLVLTFHNLKGEQGDAAGFGTIGADINGGVGTPGVSVESSGDNTAKNLMFHFTNLKGETGVTSVVATIDDTSGTPSCQASLVNGVLTLAFSGLKGIKGDTGVSADYPITLYNGLDSDATDQALTAAQGKVLDGKISQLEAKVTDIGEEIDGIPAVNISGTIPMRYNTVNQKSSGAVCDISIPAGVYKFIIDTEYIGGSGQLYVTIDSVTVSLGTVSNLNGKEVTLSGDATQFYCWANAANSPKAGDCTFSFSQDAVRGVKDDITDLNVKTKKIDGVSKDASVSFTLTTSKQTAAGTEKAVSIKSGKYWVDVSPMSLLTASNVYVYAYYASAPATSVLIGYLSTNMLNHWVLSGNTYLHEIQFSEDVVALSIYHANNATGAGNITLSFVDQEAVPSFGATIAQLTKKTSPAFSAFSDSGDIEVSGGVLALPKVHVTKNSALSLEIDGTIENVAFGIGYSAAMDNKRGYTAYWCVLKPTTLELYYSNNNTVLIDTITHGLTLDDKTKVSIRVMDNVSDRKIRITTKAGAVYENTANINFLGVGSPFVENNNTSAQISAKIAFIPCDISKRIWVFGDSYLGIYNSARWMTQIVNMGIGGFLLNAKSGEAAAEAVSDLDNLLSLGYLPTYILWCLGMNGTADGNATTVSDYQKLWLMRFLRRCTQNGITPILCTIPTVPSLQHNAYNAYIKTLGYRIVDLADAVGAQADGTWYSGLLSSDNVHPSEEGARVLAMRVLQDFPEIQLLES